MEHDDLFKQFHLDEPWDSEHNKQLLEKMPDDFKDPQQKTPPGYTVYQAVHGRGMAFEGSKGIKLAQLRDGTSKTAVVVQTAAENAVPWTRPADFEPDSDDPQKGLANIAPGFFQAVFGDGHADNILRTTKPEFIRGIFTRDGGEQLPVIFPPVQ